MSKNILLKGEDGHLFGAYEAGDPQSGAALVILQEIFGVTAHIRAVVDQYASEGFFAVAPALFDRIRTGVELDYTAAGLAWGRGFASRLEPELVLRDIAATLAYARSRTVSEKVGVVGYCLGGTYAWLSATRLSPDAAVGYYGGKIIQYVNEIPPAPVTLHFGSQDAGIPLADVQKIEQTRPEVSVYVYEAGHAFNRYGTARYSEAAASLARSRSVAFLRRSLSAVPASVRDGNTFHQSHS